MQPKQQGSRQKFIVGLIGSERAGQIGLPEYNYALSTALNCIIGDEGGASKRPGTVLALKSESKIIIKSFRYEGSNTCQLMFTPTRLIALQFEAKTYQEQPQDLQLPPHWHESDLDTMKGFDAGDGRYYVYCPMRLPNAQIGDAGRPKSMFTIYEYSPTPEEPFRIVRGDTVDFTNCPYTRPANGRKITISKEAGGVITVRVVNENDADRLISARNVGQTIIMHRLIGQASVSNYRWMELLITAVAEDGTATCNLLSPDLPEYSYPETTHMWMISAFTTNRQFGTGTLGVPDGFVRHAGRTVVWKKSMLMYSAAGADPLDFTYSPLPDSADTKKVPSTINWLYSGEFFLFVGAQDGIWAYGSTEGGRGRISGLTDGISRVSDVGVSTIQPIKTMHGLVFTEVSRSALYVLQQLGPETFAPKPLPIHIGSVMQNATITGLAMQVSPMPILWILLSDNRILSAVVTDTEFMFRLSQHELGGNVSKIASIHVSKERTRELLILNVARYINFQSVYSIESLDITSPTPKELASNKYMDALVAAEMPDPIENMIEPDILKINVHGEFEGGFLDEFTALTNPSAELAILFRNVEGWVPPGEESPTVDVIYHHPRLKYGNRANKSIDVIYNPDAVHVGNRGTPCAWGEGRGRFNPPDYWMPLLRANLMIGAFLNIEFGEEDKAVALAFETELTDEQINTIHSMRFFFSGIGDAIWADGLRRPRPGFDTAVFKLQYLEIENVFLVLTYDGDIVVGEISDSDEAAVATQRAIVYIGNARYLYECGEQRLSEIELTKGVYKDDWNKPEDQEIWHNFKFDELYGNDEYNDEDVVLMPNRTVMPQANGPWPFHILINPAGTIVPVQMQDEVISEYNTRILLYKQIKVHVTSIRRELYKRFYDKDAERSTGYWNLVALRKDDFRTLLGTEVLMCVNGRARGVFVDLDDDKFVNVDGEDLFLLKPGTYSVAFGYLYTFEIQPVPLVNIDQFLGVTKGKHARLGPILASFTMSRGGTYSATLQDMDRGNRELSYPILYKDEEREDDNMEGVEDFYGPPPYSTYNSLTDKGNDGIKLDMQHSQYGQMITCAIRQVMPVNITVNDFVHKFEYTR